MTTITVLGKDALKLIRQYISKIKSVEEVNSLLHHVNGTIRILRKAIKNRLYEDSVLENRFSLECTLSYLKCYRYKLKNIRKQVSVKTGAGVTDRQSKVSWEDTESCFNGRIRTGFISNVNIKDPLEFLKRTFRPFKFRVKNEVEKCLLKINVALSTNFVKPQTGEVDLKTFVTKNSPIDQATDLKQWYQEYVIDKLKTKLEEFAEKDSGWALLEVLGLKVNINEYDPLKFGYSTFTPLPSFIMNKKAVINVKNDDQYCFLWAVVSALYPADRHSNRTSSYPHFKDVLKYDGINFPITLKDIDKFELLNCLSINVYCVEQKKILPCRLSSNNKAKENNNNRTINLLMLPVSTNHPTNTQPYHFVWIKSLSRLIARQLSSDCHRLFICERCLNYFSTTELLQKHQIICSSQNNYCIRLPKEADKYLYFKNHRHQEKLPFAIYADLESILENCSDGGSDKNLPKTIAFQKHVAFSVAYYFKCSYDEGLCKFQLYRGRDCIQWFVNELKSIAHLCDEIFKNTIPIQTLDNNQRNQFSSADQCHICGEQISAEQVRVRDHNHQTGQFRGAAHQNCNLNYKDVFTVPVVFHNLSGYDAHFIIRELCTSMEGAIKLLPINKEKYISFTKFVSNTKISFRFIDSFRFMPYALQKLSNNLTDEQKSITKSHCSNTEEFNLVTRKGVFPYDYINSWDKLDEPSLPPREKFRNALTDEDITDEDYHHALNVWNAFNIQTMGQYSDLYLKTDVLLLADVFEAFRNTCMNTYKLDPLHYYTAPGLTFDAMLKTTKVRLELLTDIDKVLFIERGIRGGVSQCSNRYAKANNKYMMENYDATTPSSYLMYFDVNNLYGAAMSEYLPYGEFEFIESYDISEILNTPDNSDTGYIVECDLEYPTVLHDEHSDLPLAPEHMVPPTATSKIKKLLLTLYPKHNYIVHYRNLKMYIENSLKLTNVHKVLRFKQSQWLKEYVDLNTKLRQQSKNDFEKDFYKLMNNAIYGKCMENVRKHKDVRLVTKWDGRWAARALIAKPNFHSSVVFDDDVAIIEMNKLEVFMNKPIYVGFTILDISKTFLYEFHYGYIKKELGNRAKLLYTDTDSLIYNFQDLDIYEYIKRDGHRFDTSDYPLNNIFGIPLQNKKVPGLMKDENNGKIMLEFVGLRSKMYAFTVEGQEKKLVKKSKGSTKASIKKITLEDYKACLFDKTVFEGTQRLIRSKHHVVYTIKQVKVVLSPYDDKRMLNYLHTDTRPWGFNYNLEVGDAHAQLH